MAAYKAAELCRRLLEQGNDVYPVLTEGARRFVSDELFESLSHHPIPHDLHAQPLWHTDVGRSIDLALVAPASANFIACLAQGMADDLLLATLLVSRAPKLLVPAMNDGMWENPLTQANVEKLRKLGYAILEPGHGWLACGVKGQGRFPEPDSILKFVRENIKSTPAPARTDQSWVGKRVVVTLGPTREAIDPVRYISNRSSGKLGLAIAQACAQRGADVVMIGPPEIMGSDAEMQDGTRIAIESSDDLQKALKRVLRQSVDVLWMTAAVSDYRPKRVSRRKLGRDAKVPALAAVDWEATPDLLAELAQKGPQRPKRVVGFCLVDRDLKAATRQKRAAKNTDVMIGNTPENLGAEKATVLWCDAKTQTVLKGSKQALAQIFCDKLQTLL